MAATGGTGARDPGNNRGMARGTGDTAGGIPGIFYSAAGQRAHGCDSGRNGFSRAANRNQGPQLNPKCARGHRLSDLDSPDGVFLP